jgi:hypothetical protein
MKKKNGVNHSLLIATKSCRKGVIERLNAQLKSGVKNPGKKIGVGTNKPVPLTDSDRVRIQKELDTLKTRI